MALATSRPLYYLECTLSQEQILNLANNQKPDFEKPGLEKNRAGDGIRTHDLLLGKETFYH
jgi:hypothetical protein